MMHLDSYQMKENVDINIMHVNQNIKGTQEKPGSLIKRQLFGQIDPNNQTRRIKKTAYIVDSQQESSQKSHIKDCRSHRSIDDVSQIIDSNSRDVSPHTSPQISQQNPISQCETHSKDIYTYNYCINCSIYMLCYQCVKNDHSNHMILTFSSQTEAKCLTKQFLIQKIEESLQKLKSKQNDLKNKSAELQLIAVNVKKMQDEVIDKLQRTFRQIGQLVRSVYQRDQSFYEQKIQQFYEGYNILGDEIRQNLLTIIDESFNIKTFRPQLISKEPPLVPDSQISKFKSTLQRTKKFYKSIIDSLDELKQKTIQSSKLSSKVIRQGNVIGTRKNSINKYEKFLSDNCFNDNGQQAKSSLIRILDTLSR